MLNCSRNGKYILLNCLINEKELYDKFKRALTTLQEVSDTFKSPKEYFTDSDLEIVRKICENWVENWPIDFPHPKAHNLIFVLPEILKRRR